MKSIFRIITITFLFAANVNGQEIKFIPQSSTQGSLIPKPIAPFHGKYTSVTEAFEDDGKYYMLVNDLVNGWPTELINISLLESEDLKTWKWHEKPLLTSKDLPYNLKVPNAYATSIIKMPGGEYYMYMDILDSDKSKGIGLAVSNNLKGPWRVREDFMLLPNKKGWDKESLAGADVIRSKEGEYLMYYMGVPDSIANGETAVCLATSKDGINWQRRSQPIVTKSSSGFDSHKVGVPKVIYDRGMYYMLYRSDSGDGSWGADSAYGLMQSKDGLEWERMQSEPVLTEYDVSNWRTIWACGFLAINNEFHLLLEYDGPPVYGTRINHAVYKRK
ncbi:family 43 glycosylhydrolase [Roseivirga sp.]|uniref:family 43 glycosylhydrolase n=1 Tax=Roseivirga sp. TaxID=1964215 RepID=UPI003B5202C7